MEVTNVKEAMEALAAVGGFIAKMDTPEPPDPAVEDAPVGMPDSPPVDSSDPAPADDSMPAADAPAPDPNAPPADGTPSNC